MKRVGIANYQSKLKAIHEILGVPLQFFVSLADDKYRKPRTGMWHEHIVKHNDSREIDLAESRYIGDAAGRKACKGKKADFSNSDRFFAENLGIPFMLPEEFWLGEQPPSKDLVNPPAIVPSNIPAMDKSRFSKASTKEIVIMVGFPASGKSYISQQFFAEMGYEVVNRDVHGTWQKCCSLMVGHLEKGKSVVVDNTNVDKESRSRYILAAKKHDANIKIRAFLMQTSSDQCKHNELYRQLTGSNHQAISTMVLNMMKKKFEEPEKSEGFDEIIKVPFQIDKDGVDPIFYKHLLEK
ncbi:hypothetical protein Ciccas_005100 [Cichlidogyrus casuarinus]|uniref:Bifunctional polynucleotide phosphatase/kinase n=1 Tax=Cichlidogyrus casuarinus TaxID=1844966 RepID=A0ABD2Q9L3_9PLAT